MTRRECIEKAAKEQRPTIDFWSFVQGALWADINLADCNLRERYEMAIRALEDHDAFEALDEIEKFK